ncbi:hypothetical protein BASA62_007865 [Batrachochytrium salamandrivorans]|nr:hypothetical protein BASA62_007865 [Batrachochytrium salamandrivorans]
MVDIPLILVLALVSSTVVAQPDANGLTGIFACFKQQTTSEISTKSVYQWIPPNEEAPAPTSDQDPAEIGLSYILQQLNLQPDEFSVRTNFTDSLGVTHMYGVPSHKGLDIGNLHAAAHVTNGQVFFYSATIKNDPILTKRSPTTPESTVEKSSEEAVSAAVDCLGVPFYDDIAPVKESYRTDDRDIPVWKFQLRDNPITQWFEVKVDINTGVVVSKESFKRGFTYKAIELPNESPNDGFSTIVDPENIQASSEGWTKGYKLTGNNALAKSKRGKTFKTTTLGIFSVDFDPTLPPQTPRNTAVGVINAFYVANMVHDVFYAYGFTEPAGNFQQKNFGRGGKEGDPVIINVKVAREKMMLLFIHPPDGQSGVLDLHIFTDTEPNRDSALDNTVIAHELAHGLSDRLTGGALDKYVYGGNRVTRVE